MTIFDIPSARLIDLSDADLRELVALLCEAERERQGGHKTEVKWGGAQTAADGGLDVAVSSLGAFRPSPVLPRLETGIQVKKGKMEPAEIIKEMTPKGVLRSSISELSSAKGAYLIVSAAENCSKVMLDRRRSAMRDAVAEAPNAANLLVDFIDSSALARWVSSIPSVHLWLREKLGLPLLRSWKPYGAWSSTPTGVADELILAHGVTVRIGHGEPIQKLVESIEAVRNEVRAGQKALRIIGLSGVGKSRLVQALFEDTGEGKPLPASQAVYADAGHGPEPSVLSMLEILIAGGKPVILIVDNCPPAVHQTLAERLSKSDGTVKLITVEYDLRDDRPLETEVIRIDADGTDMAETLISRRYGQISHLDARRLAELAQGNARLALALADAAPSAGSLSAFQDNQLFERLFWQNGVPDLQLSEAAGALSLVYSYDVDGEEDRDELQFLSGLIEANRRSLYGATSALLSKGLVQARGRWRAVLPHALANRLAAEALRSNDIRVVADAFAQDGGQRLRTSFSKRLAYLHVSPEAERIVERWAIPGGPFDSSVHDPDNDCFTHRCRIICLESFRVKMVHRGEFRLNFDRSKRDHCQFYAFCGHWVTHQLLAKRCQSFIQLGNRRAIHRIGSIQ